MNCTNTSTYIHAVLYSNEFEDMQALVWSAMLQQSNIFLSRRIY